MSETDLQHCRRLQAEVGMFLEDKDFVELLPDTLPMLVEMRDLLRDVEEKILGQKEASSQ